MRFTFTRIDFEPNPCGSENTDLGVGIQSAAFVNHQTGDGVCLDQSGSPGPKVPFCRGGSGRGMVQWLRRRKLPVFWSLVTHVIAWVKLSQ